jgi:hypothetical protein
MEIRDGSEMPLLSCIGIADARDTQAMHRFMTPRNSFFLDALVSKGRRF